jgi:hypothetical protein
VAIVVVVLAGSVMAYKPVLELANVLNVLAPVIVNVPVPATPVRDRLLYVAPPPAKVSAEALVFESAIVLVPALIVALVLDHTVPIPLAVHV